MGIKSAKEYIDFFRGLDMGENVSLQSFINNEKMVLKQKLQYKGLKKEPIKDGIKILDMLTDEVKVMGQDVVIQKYR